MYVAAGAIEDAEMLTFRKLGSRIEGHPTPLLPWVDVATGSLGQGLPVGVGVALAGKQLDKLPFRVWVLCGDSEMAEGSMWEAMEHAAHAGLDNLTAIIDVNRLGQTGETMHGWDLDAYARRAQVAGWHAIEINGHDVAEIDEASTDAAATSQRPTMIVARTEKGHGVAAVANQNGAHGKPLADPEAAIAELGGLRHIRVAVAPPEGPMPAPRPEPEVIRLPAYEVGTSEATRRAYGEALAAVGSARREVVALDGEVSNSTYAEIFREAHPDRYFEMYIAEQQLVAAAVGLQVRGYRPFASTFAAFLTRAYDFIRMAAISRANMSLVGSHAGVSHRRGRAVPDGPRGHRHDAGRPRQHRPVPVRCQPGGQPGGPDGRPAGDRVPAHHAREAPGPVRAGRAVSHRRGAVSSGAHRDDQVTLVGAGITLHQALAAAEQLAGEGIAARVVDLYSVKPVDEATLREAAAATGRFITVEDHWPEGGLGDAVLDVFAGDAHPPQVVKLAVRAMPGSATPAEQLAAAGIDAAAIVVAARDLVGVAQEVSVS